MANVTDEGSREDERDSCVIALALQDRVGGWQEIKITLTTLTRFSYAFFLRHFTATVHEDFGPSIFLRSHNILEQEAMKFHRNASMLVALPYLRI